ncbi:MAG: alpha/beta hydrolase [Burkholderiales bacterium]|nr:alpha/beta hydrolase [Burkholderiales bacterium]
MHYEQHGSGTPGVVFVHGYTCDLTDWRPQLAALQDRYCVVACDLRGHGRTPGAAHDCSIETYGADVAALIAALDRGPAVLVGHSMGCRVVLEARRLNPQRVAGLVLVDGSCTGFGDRAGAEQAMRAKIDAMGYAAFSEERFHDMFPVPYAGAQAIIARCRKTPAAVGSGLFPRMIGWDAQWMDAALALRGPIMIIQSTYMGAALKRACLNPGESSPWLDRVRGAAPHARIETIPGVGHFTQLEAAGMVNRLLESFIGELDPGD